MGYGRLVSGVIVALSLSACASMSVTDAQLKQSTAFALGLEQDEFVISNRVDSGIKSSYTVKTKDGRQYNCYVEGMISFFGRSVSDAVCSEKGKPVGNPFMR